MSKIVAIIVTYNRKELLSVCLDAVGKQIYKPSVVYIVDNASSDGTGGWIHAEGYDRFKLGIEFRYIHMVENIGGAGGFYVGLKTAYEAEDLFDAFWLMDDDGIPEANQLQKLVNHLKDYDYLSPLVVSKEEQSKISFDRNQKVNEYVTQANEKGLIENVAFPFNGVLYSRKLVEQVGYPIKEMFIWGDEVNYHLRCISKGIVPAVVVDAIHVHPADRQIPKIIFGNRKIVVPQQDWKLYCFVRNKMYNLRALATFRHLIGDVMRMLFRYTMYFTFYYFNWNKLRIVYRAMMDGAGKNFSRLEKYK